MIADWKTRAPTSEIDRIAKKWNAALTEPMFTNSILCASFPSSVLTSVHSHSLKWLLRINDTSVPVAKPLPCGDYSLQAIYGIQHRSWCKSRFADSAPNKVSEYLVTSFSWARQFTMHPDFHKLNLTALLISWEGHTVHWNHQPAQGSLICCNPRIKQANGVKAFLLSSWCRHKATSAPPPADREWWSIGDQIQTHSLYEWMMYLCPLTGSIYLNVCTLQTPRRE